MLKMYTIHTRKSSISIYYAHLHHENIQLFNHIIDFIQGSGIIIHHSFYTQFLTTISQLKSLNGQRPTVVDSIPTTLLYV